MGLNITPGGMGIAFQGARQGQQDVLNRQWQQEDRDFLSGQRQRTIEAQEREDTLRRDLSSVTPAGADVPVSANAETAQITHDDTTGPDEATPAATQLPVTKKRTQDQELRDAAAAHRKAGDIGKAYELGDAADKIAFNRATARFRSILPGSEGLSTAELARRIGRIYDADPTSGGIKAIEETPDGARITIRNRDSGATDTREFKGPAGRQQLIDEFHAYYNPASWQKIQDGNAAARAKALEKQLEEASKSHVVPGGATLVRPDNSQVHVPKEFSPSTGGVSGGKEPKPPLDEAAKIIEDALTKGELKFSTPQQYTTARDYAGRVMKNNPGIPPERAAQIAVDAAVNPASVMPAVNKQTGAIDSVYKAGDGQAYTLVPNVATPDSLAQSGIKPEAIKRDVGAMITAQGDATFQRQLSAAAFDTKARDAMLASAQATVEAAIEQALQKNRSLPSPLPEDRVRAEGKAKLDAITANVDRKLALIRYTFTADELGVGPQKATKKFWGEGNLWKGLNAAGMSSTDAVEQFADDPTVR